ncbi:MAG: AsnC family transcriptional regulator [bacterium]
MPKSKIPLTELDRRIIRILQDDLPLVEAPYEVIARGLGVSQEELLERIRRMKQTGVLRRFGATLRHQKVGYVANAMSAWVVPPERLEEVGKLLASYEQVTHCYERPPGPNLPYNLYAMIHGKDPQDCKRIAQEVAHLTGLNEYVLLFSNKENKKSSMQYF